MNSSFATIVHLTFVSKIKGCGPCPPAEGDGRGNCPNPVPQRRNLSFSKREFPRNPLFCAVFICVGVAAFGGALLSHTAPHSAKLSLLQQRFPLTDIQKIVAVAGLPMTFSVQFLRSASDVDEPTVTQNIQRPFDTGA